MIQVVAALIESDGKLLVCQPHTGDSFELLWEFPGGKIEPGESLEAALARELFEELGVDARIGREVYRTLHQYSELREPIELTFFTAQVDPARVCNLVFERRMAHTGKPLRARLPPRRPRAYRQAFLRRVASPLGLENRPQCARKLPKFVL
jgi:mutator protein MutT